MKRSAVVLVMMCALASGCLVSFDGYQALEAGDAGQGGDAGKGVSGSSNGGKGSGTSGSSSSNGGTSGDGGELGSGGVPSEEGGSGSGGNSAGSGAMSGGGSASGGTSGSGGSAPGGSGPGGSGGNAGSGGASAGSGGTSSGGTSGSGGGGGSGGTPPKTCPIDLKGPLMVEVPKPGGGSYCIDRTEVTNKHYSDFLAASPAVNQNGVCSWNNSYQPDVSAACAIGEGVYDPVGHPQQPVACIDWCDAKRYCEWAGKRLCGKFGGGNNPTASFADANASEWYRACSKAGTLKFPYGNTYQGSACAGLDGSGSHPSNVTSKVACIGGYDGLYDMSGNVAEWEDSCNGSAGQADGCAIRGGSINDADIATPTVACNSAPINGTLSAPITATRGTRDELIGVRCCLDL
jgi:formylglycine-generating enzyme required for sulfatase activity